LRLETLRAHRPQARDQASALPALPGTNERKNRTLHQNPALQLGLRSHFTPQATNAWRPRDGRAGREHGRAEKVRDKTSHPLPPFHRSPWAWRCHEGDSPSSAATTNDFPGNYECRCTRKPSTDRPAGIPTPDERMEDARAVMDASGLECAHVMGWSEGGPLAVMLAAAHPERVQSLVLYGTQASFVRRGRRPRHGASARRRSSRLPDGERQCRRRRPNLR
jgi:pimeloyl-ACP methyl ester carboxylesterase